MHNFVKDFASDEWPSARAPERTMQLNTYIPINTHTTCIPVDVLDGLISKTCIGFYWNFEIKPKLQYAM